MRMRIQFIPPLSIPFAFILLLLTYFSHPAMCSASVKTAADAMQHYPCIAGPESKMGWGRNLPSLHSPNRVLLLLLLLVRYSLVLCVCLGWNGKRGLCSWPAGKVIEVNSVRWGGNVRKRLRELWEFPPLPLTSATRDERGLVLWVNFRLELTLVGFRRERERVIDLFICVCTRE